MNGSALASLITGVLADSEGMVRSILGALNVADKAEPWLALGYVGVRFLQQVLGARNADEVKAILSRSPRELWGEARSVEVEIALVREAQLDQARARGSDSD